MCGSAGGEWISGRCPTRLPLSLVRIRLLFGFSFVCTCSSFQSCDASAPRLAYDAKGNQAHSPPAASWPSGPGGCAPVFPWPPGPGVASLLWSLCLEVGSRSFGTHSLIHSFILLFNTSGRVPAPADTWPPKALCGGQWERPTLTRGRLFPVGWPCLVVLAPGSVPLPWLVAQEAPHPRPTLCKPSLRRLLQAHCRNDDVSEFPLDGFPAGAEGPWPSCALLFGWGHEVP